MNNSAMQMYVAIKKDMGDLETIAREIRKTENLLRRLKRGIKGDPTVTIDGDDLSADMARLAKALMIRELSGRLEGLYQNYISQRNCNKFSDVTEEDITLLKVDELV